MSDYRDDTNETVVVSDDLFSALRDAAESTLFISAALIFSLYVGTTDAAVVSDEITDAWLVSPVTEVATIHDLVVASRRVEDSVTEAAVCTGEVVAASAGGLTQETLTVGDVVIENLVCVLADAAIIGDDLTGVLTVHHLVTETAGISDTSLQAAATLVDESAAVADTITQTLVGHTLVSETCLLGDLLLESVNLMQYGESSAVAGDAVDDALHAVQLVLDHATIEDAVSQSGATGQAWTADSGSWAMSRYAPLTAHSLVTIDGVLYAAMSDGVYALDDDAEQQLGVVETGRMLLGDVKSLPRYVHIEYELDGVATLHVTQSGGGRVAETYAYALIPRPSDTDTSGRFVLGKGLRDKRFVFRLEIEGVRAEVYGLSIDVAPLGRRI